ncbi:MAG: hypothetical protein IT475_18210, partial [Aquimonas sp.]|nr:hypothetical protein [Aquimonas sp.]
MNRFTTAALAALLLLVAADARAALYCVDNEAQLRAALATIGSSFDTSVHEIRLTQR